MGAFLLFLDWSALRTRRHRARRASYLLGKVKRVRYEADMLARRHRAELGTKAGVRALRGEQLNRPLGTREPRD